MDMIIAQIACGAIVDMEKVAWAETVLIPAVIHFKKQRRHTSHVEIRLTILLHKTHKIVYIFFENF